MGNLQFIKYNNAFVSVSAPDFRNFSDDFTVYDIIYFTFFLDLRLVQHIHQLACQHDLLHSLTFFILKISMSCRVAIGCHDSFKQRLDSTSVVPAAGGSCVTEFESAVLAHKCANHITNLRGNCCAGF